MRQPPTRAHCGRVRAGVLADALVLVGFEADLVGFLGLGRSALDQPDGAEDEQRELQVLGLPVLEHVDAELGRAHIAPQRDRVAVVGELDRVEVGVPDERLRDQRAEKERAESEAEPVRAHRLRGSRDRAR